MVVTKKDIDALDECNVSVEYKDGHNDLGYLMVICGIGYLNLEPLDLKTVRNIEKTGGIA